jgi:hypothetical protein
MNTHEDRFEDRLLLALRSVVDANPAPVHSLAPAGRSLRRPVLVGGVVAGAAVTASTLLVAGGSSAAYAVDAHSDGSVTVTINSLKDASGLQHKLAAAGIKAVVDYLPSGKACQQPRYKPASSAAQGSIYVDTRKGGSTTFTIANGQIASGDTLVIESSGGTGFSTIGVGVADGAVVPCQVVDATLPPGGGDVSGPGMTTGKGSEGGTSKNG